MRSIRLPLLFHLIAALSMASCQSLQIPQSPLLAALETKSGRIVYVGLDGHIYTMNQAGNTLTNITIDASLNTPNDRVNSYFYPTWSPNGERLAFIGYHRKGAGNPEVSIYTARADASDFLKIYSDLDQQPFYLYWLPNNEEVSFLSGTPDDSSFTLNIVPAAGGDTLAVGHGAPFYWAWSPDSESLVVNTSSLTDSGIVTGRLAIVHMHPNLTQSILSLRPSVFQSPVYSPNGNYFVVAAEDTPDLRYLLLATSEGQALTKLTNFDSRVAFDWSPDGQHIAYISGNAAPPFGMLGTLGLIDMTNPETPFSSDVAINTVMAFYWSPNGKNIAYFAPALDNDSDTGATKLLLQLSVLDVASGKVTGLGAFESPDVMLAQIFPHFDQYQRSSTIWSPDGNYLVINAITDDETPGIYVVNASGDFPPRLVQHGVLPFWSRN